jgi:3',5'-cyclic AMP phosphodiesterase CpdA
MKFVQISDIHLVAPGGLVYGLDPKERLESCIEDINSQHPDADFAVITGDLTQRGEERAYRLLDDLLKRLNMPVHLLIGNHDDRRRFQTVFPLAAKDPNGFVQFSLDTPVGRFIGLDTNDPAGHYGTLCQQRLDWLDARLGEAAGRATYLLMHHAPLSVGLREMDRIALQDSQRFGDIITSRGNVRHIFFGHLHRSLSGSWHGVPFSSLPGTNHQVALDFVVDHVVPGSHEPPAYAVAFVSPDATLVHLRNFADRTATFNL